MTALPYCLSAFPWSSCGPSVLWSLSHPVHECHIFSIRAYQGRWKLFAASYLTFDDLWMAMQTDLISRCIPAFEYTICVYLQARPLDQSSVRNPSSATFCAALKPEACVEYKVNVLEELAQSVKAQILGDCIACLTTPPTFSVNAWMWFDNEM